ncbi:MAG: NAD(P)H-dependent oxidoreductase [Treponemataceae bacterium]|nr:NAD(P)H-dependent oxidoreductase [Treponemataceae bacterium]
MIALINGSPKKADSASEIFCRRIKSYEPAPEVTFTDAALHDCTVTPETLATLTAADTWMFVFPLYSDGIPGHLLDCLQQIAARSSETGAKKVYAVVGMGFFEGHQTQWALRVMANFCAKAGHEYCGGVGVGGTGAFGSLGGIPPFKGPMGTVDTPLLMLREYAAKGTVIGDTFTTIQFPRIAYRFAGQANWRKATKAFGNKAKDLGRRITLDMTR